MSSVMTSMRHEVAAVIFLLFHSRILMPKDSLGMTSMPTVLSRSKLLSHGSLTVQVDPTHVQPLSMSHILTR